MQLTKAQEHALRTLARVGVATREWRTMREYDWRWMLDGEPKSAHIEGLYKLGLVRVEEHRATLTDLARRYLELRRAA